MAETVIVIPCYNEAGRLAADRFLGHLEVDPETDFLFVDDGSRDGTLAALRQLASLAPGRIEVLSGRRNRGKAEAVRRGMNAAFERDAHYVGYFDADLATPLSEVPRLVAVLRARPRCEIVFGSRVQLLGRTIERKRLRHYLGRIFATVASECLGLAVYDTQCGAKLFRVTPDTRALFGEPFHSSWVFDVEIIARLIAMHRDRDASPAAETIYELPLDHWIDVPGSKVGALDFFRAIRETWWIHRHYRARSARAMR